MSYDNGTHSLKVVYVSGVVYEYLAVPEQEFEAMKKATSKGRYLNNHIKTKYRFRKLSD
jgi:hypothetical protein